jgi:serralysin
LADIPDDSTTTATLTLGVNFHGRIETAGDEDWIAVVLQAGTVYNFSLASSGLTPLADPLLSILDGAGNILAVDDDSGNGLNAHISGFTVTQTGTYYLSASSAVDTDTGQYRLTGAIATPPSFLDSIDWGTEVARTEIKIYFAAAGESFDGETSQGWNAYERAQAMLAFQQYASVCNLTFTATATESEADFRLLTDLSSDTLGYFNPPGATNEGVGVFSRIGDGWDEGGGGALEKGGYGFLTLVHEIGHGLGLAHPHDRGGDSTKWEGVTSAFGSYGTFDLNQGIYSVMSYNDGWQLHPAGETPSQTFGYLGGPMAFDVAAMQDKYGANADFHAGNDVYALPTVNAAGTFFTCIWDGGGTDTISFAGLAAATIDLRAAHLEYAEGSGGYISFAKNIFGGFTIAHGVVIENALGGDGADRVTGNDASNELRGRGGRDVLKGGAGDDLLIGGRSADRLEGGLGGDTMKGQAGADSLLWTSFADSGVGPGHRDRVADFRSGQDVLDFSGIVTSAVDGALVWLDQAAFDGTAGCLRWKAVQNGVLLLADADGLDGADFQILLIGVNTLLQSDVIL